MRAFKLLGPQGKDEIGLLDTLDCDQDISNGTDLLHKVGEQCHPLASRYLHWFQKLERKLLSLSLGRNREAEAGTQPVDMSSRNKQGRAEDASYSFSNTGNVNETFGMDDSLVVSNEELSEIENMFFCNFNGWVNSMED